MTFNNAYSQYKNNSINTARPEELTLMLYNGLVKFLMKAVNEINENTLDKANESIIRAQDIIQEFRATLDMKYEVSNGLSLIYDYMNRRLIDANVKKDNSIVEEILNLAKELRDTWEQAIKLSRHQQKRAVGSEL